MNADISDAPVRITRKRATHERAGLALCLVVMGLATFGAVHWVHRPSAVGLEGRYHNLGPEVVTGSISQASEPLPLYNEPTSLRQVPRVSGTPLNAPRQTVFNDQNFTPRGADNVVTFAKEPIPATESPPTKRVPVTIVAQPTSMKTRLCRPYAPGSIELRNCHAQVGLRFRD
ncbi:MULTISPECIES: hypothetical protein [Pseudomonas]|uniref:Uncharacterized protein n=1 Tax=Pseudomonas quercus TaxID=2722792 RepID=A0ABX0YMC0_9PSED|nr:MULTISPECIES: hypothetical protein [Pseudomonas]MBF7144767.1 hypothetical protein [Pseudomonas sp. LY10J]NJP03304.1 hypothetical protein [Pseudomonas quercus]